MCCWTNLRYLEYYQTWTWPKIINSIVLGAYSLNENLQNLLSTAPVLAYSSSCKESKALVLSALQSFFCDTCRQKQLTLGTVPEPLAASSPCLPVPAWPRQLKNAKKGPVAEGKENTDFLLSRDTLQLRRAAKSQGQAHYTHEWWEESQNYELNINLWENASLLSGPGLSHMLVICHGSVSSMQV